LAQKWAVAPCCWKMRSTSASVFGNTKFSSISTRGGALVEGTRSSNLVRRDAAPRVDLGAIANTLHEGMWGLIASSPAIVVVCNKVCVKSGLVGDDMTMAPAFMQPQLVAVRFCHLSRIHVTKTWTNFALNFGNVPNLWFSSE
jgi:hypothetical protein